MPDGDATRHLPLAHLERQLAMLSPPRDVGRVSLLVARTRAGRETPEAMTLTAEAGVPGDAWSRSGRSTDSQVAVMRVDVARLLANGQPLTLFGDNLLVDLDLSAPNLPAGSRLRAGGVVFEVTPKPHTGCAKFRQRFGADALALTADARFRDARLRGLYLRVVEPGEVSVGDAIEVLERGRA